MIPGGVAGEHNRDVAAGLAPSLSADAARAWDDFAFLALSYRSGAEEALGRVIAHDPGAALPHALAALFGWLGDPRFDRDVELAAARAGRAAAEWERSLVHVVVRTCTEGRWAALDDWERHHDRFPGDLIGFTFAALWVLTSARPGRFERVEGMVARSRRAAGDDPSLLGALAMIEQDRGELERAHVLASRVLDLDPGHYGGAHPLAHVYFEDGSHAAGLAWLDDWLAGADRESDWFAHLSWHGALHVLALGDGDAAVESYLSCTRLQGVTSLVDRTSLLWRCQLHGLVPHAEDPADSPTVGLVQRWRADPPTCFVGFHVVIGLAAAGDVAGLQQFAAAAARMSAPGAAELLPPVARGLAAYLCGDQAVAADLLLATLPDLVRVGGSHAQREIVEDTAIEALVRAGRADEAARLLQGRLDRRESLLDRRWLVRARRPLFSPA